MGTQVPRGRPMRSSCSRHCIIYRARPALFTPGERLPVKGISGKPPVLLENPVWFRDPYCRKLIGEDLMTTKLSSARARFKRSAASLGIAALAFAGLAGPAFAVADDPASGD